MAWLFTSWHHLYLQVNLHFSSHHIILPTLPQDPLRLREWHHCALTGVIMGKQFFLDASERGGDVMSAVLLKVHCLTLGSPALSLVPLLAFILANVEVITLQAPERTL